MDDNVLHKDDAKESIHEDKYQQIQDLFGEMRDFTPEEEHAYRLMLLQASKPIDINLTPFKE